MKRRRGSFWWGAGLFVLAACAGPGAVAPAGKSVTTGIFPRGASDPFYSNTVQALSERATLGKGDALLVKLPGNPTTGYLWVLVSGDDKVLKSQGDPDYRPAASTPLGSGGEFTFTFHAVAPGRATLKFACLRPWEKDVPPVKTFEVMAVVQ